MIQIMQKLVKVGMEKEQKQELGWRVFISALCILAHAACTLAACQWAGGLPGGHAGGQGDEGRRGWRGGRAKCAPCQLL